VLQFAITGIMENITIYRILIAIYISHCALAVTTRVTKCWRRECLSSLLKL